MNNRSVKLDKYIDIIEYTKLSMSSRVADLIKKGADPNEMNRYGDRAIIWAAKHNDMETMKILVDNGASLDVYGCAGMSPLDYARFNRSVEMEKFILNSMNGIHK